MQCATVPANFVFQKSTKTESRADTQVVYSISGTLVKVAGESRAENQ